MVEHGYFFIKRYQPHNNNCLDQFLTEHGHGAPALIKVLPMEDIFNDAEEFNSLELHAVVQDLDALMTDSQNWP
jgi:catalase (peroxidase I)